MHFRFNKPYQIINIIFAGIIILLFIYSGIFSARKENHPIPSNSGLVFGKKTPSTGLSRAFSEIVRFNFKNAKRYNPHSIMVFMFFFIQFFLRIGFFWLSLNMKKKKLNQLIVLDSSFSIVLLLYCFLDIIPL